MSIVRSVCAQEASLCAGLSAEAAAELAEWRGAARGMLRRLDVVLLTLQGVAVERDPAKRLEVTTRFHNTHLMLRRLFLIPFISINFYSTFTSMMY